MRIATGILLRGHQILHRNGALLDTVIACTTSSWTGIKCTVRILIRIGNHFQTGIRLVIRVIEIPWHQIASPAMSRTSFVLEILAESDAIGREKIISILISGQFSTRNGPYRLIIHFIGENILIVFRKRIPHRLHTLGIR